MNYLLYLCGFIPSLIWLLFYLRKDSHPESNRMVVKVFLAGVLAGLTAIVLEKIFQKSHNILTASSVGQSWLIIFLGGAFIEEIVKFLAVRWSVLRTSELDEPLDIMLYMIITALGFAALENVLLLNNYETALTSAKTIEIISWRFISATFLHALCSGTLGYFWALSLYHTAKKKEYIFTGIVLSIILHGLYNWSIMKVAGVNKFILPLIILISLAVFVSIGFKQLKSLKSTCNI